MAMTYRHCGLCQQQRDDPKGATANVRTYDVGGCASLRNTPKRPEPIDPARKTESSEECQRTLAYYEGKFGTLEPTT
jgi:hypothetical protein